MTTREPLTGGHTSEVVRVGDEVHRTAGPWTPAVHALLCHLRAVGFTDVPEPVRTDGEVEVLRFVRRWKAHPGDWICSISAIDVPL